LVYEQKISVIDGKQTTPIQMYFLKPIWTYSFQLWGTSANSNIEIFQRFQSKTLRMIPNAPWYVTNKRIHHKLNIPTVRENKSTHYKEKIQLHLNQLACKLMDNKKSLLVD